MVTADQVVPKWSDNAKIQFNSRLNCLRKMLAELGFDIDQKSTYQRITIKQIMTMIEETGKKVNYGRQQFKMFQIKIN
jgi:hypothetical protein